MRNKSLIITLIVLLSIIAILLTVFLVLAILGVEFPFFSNNNFREINKNIIFEQNFEPEHIDKIDIISDCGDIKILENSENNIKVTIYGRNDRSLKDINFSNEEGILKFEIRGMSNKIINFGFSENDIVIYAPKEIIKEIEIKSSYGDIEIGEFENALVDLKQDCGDIDIVKIQNAIIKSSYGDVKITSLLNKCDIDLSCGDIKIENLRINEDSIIKNDLGDIKIEKTNDIFIDGKTDLGDEKIENNNRHSEITLTLKNSCGDIKVNN
mgnify:FL=1